MRPCKAAQPLESATGESCQGTTALAHDLYNFRTSYLLAARAHGDMPLANIKHDVASFDWYRIASGKGVLFLHELRRLMGEASFESMMDFFGRDNAGKRVNAAQFQAYAEKSAGKPLAAFFDSWLKLTGLPRLRLGEVSALKEHKASAPSANGNYVVQGEIIREDNGPILAKTEVTVETDAGEITKAFDLNSPRASFAVDAGAAKPRRVILEKYGCALDTKTHPYTVGSFFNEQDHAIIIYGTGNEVHTNREAAEALQKGIRESGANFTLAIKSDKDATEDDLKANHVLLIGRPDSNHWVERFRKSLPIEFGWRSFKVNGKTYANAGSAVALVAENPLNKNCSLVVLAGLNAESTWNAPTQFLRHGRRPAEVLVLPSGGSAQALILPARELVRELDVR
ncbi:MAG: hypothetical protein HY040_06075 [Planctomycetes bacterium]|nr:hypothetical protein [Planctomycetota bacterium]